MPEEKLAESFEDPFEGMEWGEPVSTDPSARDRQIAIRWVTRVGALGAATAAALNAFLFIQTEARQMLWLVAGEALAIVFLAVAIWLARRQRLDAAGYCIIFSVSLAFGVAELVHAGLTWYLAVGGLLMIFITGSLVVPRKWEAWLLTAVLFATFVVLVNGVEPLPRYDLTSLDAPVQGFALGLVAFLFLAALWRLGFVYRRIQTIRFRLLASFVALVVLPAVAVGTVSGLSNAQSAERRVVAQLESVATLKEAEIEIWLDNLRSDLATPLIGREPKVSVRVLLQEQSQSLVLQEEMRRRLLDTIQETGRFEELFLMDSQGRVFLSTDPAQEGQSFDDELFFTRGMKDYYVQPPRRDFPRMGQISIVAAQPIRDLENRTVGVLAGRTGLRDLNEIMLERAGLGDTGETYLVDVSYILLTESRFVGYTPGQTAVATQEVATLLETHQSGSGVYDGYRGSSVIGVYRWLPQLQVILLAEQARSEALQVTVDTLLVNSGVTFVAIAVALAVGWFVARGIAKPLADLAETAERIAVGDLALEAKVVRQDEIGTLAQAFNSMTAQLLGLIGGLEGRIAERTRDLERRSVYLEAAAEVGRVAVSMLDTDLLIRQVVELIRNRFELYYVGLFLVEEAGDWAVLRAGAGKTGQAMLARGHRIRVGEGMIGWSIANLQARIASRAEADAVRLVTSELPDTRSEAALPLRSRGRVIGALTVQDDKPDAFDEDIINVLQTMADQVAVALDNARLFAESQQLLEAERRALGEASREAWHQLALARPDLGYVSKERNVVSPAGRRWLPVMVQASQTGETTWDGGSTVAIPIKIRERVEGVIRLRKPDGTDRWTEEEIDLMEMLAVQLSAALESARLYRDTQQRAVRDRLVGDLTARMRETLDLEIVLEAAVQGIGEALGLEALDVRLLEPGSV